jgi:hypothetical protein
LDVLNLFVRRQERNASVQMQLKLLSKDIGRSSEPISVTPLSQESQINILVFSPKNIPRHFNGTIRGNLANGWSRRFRD